MHACFPVPDMSMMFPGITGSSVHNLVFPPGEFGVFESFWGFLRVSDMFAGVLVESLAMLCV